MTLRRAAGHMCRRVCRRVRQLPEDTDLKSMRELVQLLKELSALIRELEDMAGQDGGGPRIRLAQEVEDFAG